MKVITKMTGLRLLEEAINGNLSCGTMVRYKREDIILTSNPPQPVYEYYIFTKGDGRFHRCDENGKLGAKGQNRFMGYATMKKELEVVELEKEEPLEDMIDENLFEDKEIEKIIINSCENIEKKLIDGSTIVLPSNKDEILHIAYKLNELIDVVNELKKGEIT